MLIFIGITWLVTVAAEMLLGSTGIGNNEWNDWNDWNHLDLTSVIFSILAISMVGIALDTIFACVQTAV